MVIQTAKISIIVPVYNAQAYIDPCIQSVLSQSFQDIELILIDDGSTDDSLNKCRCWERDPRVTLISTENRGVSAARNLGLQHASGEWIMFLDSDDYLLEGCLDGLMAMVSPDTRLVIGAYADDGQAVSTALHQSVSADAVRTMTLDPINHRLLPEFYEVRPLSLPSCCGKLYRRDVIRENSLGFREELRLSEDTCFNLDYLSCIGHVCITNLPVVYYRQNTTSVTAAFNPKHLSNRLRFFDLLKEGNDPDAAVHILSLLFLEAFKIEQRAVGNVRKQLERELIGYLSENPDLLLCTKKRGLSTGRWQRAVYQAVAGCFRHRAYPLGFAALRAYAAATQVKHDRSTRNE